MAGVRVLVVEDNALNRELTCDLLESGRYEVLTALTAEDAVRLARLHRPDLILMDIALPGMDGLAATEQVKNSPETASIPVVALTAHAMHGYREQALAAGCAGYITKPINTRTFLAEVAHFLDESAPAAA